MKIHREGRVFLSIALVVVIAAGFASFLTGHLAWYLITGLLFVLFLFFLQFFRNPSRTVVESDNDVLISPADGKVVTIEEVDDHETGLKKRIQISIFMSPLNVHANRVPIDGTLEYFKYHAGKYLVAWHPKSSTENERTTFVINTGKHKVVLRQIAGAVARRIVSYPTQGSAVTKGEELGFIKFGSRCDIFLPQGSEVLVDIGDAVKGNIDSIARLPK